MKRFLIFMCLLQGAGAWGLWAMGITWAMLWGRPEWAWGIRFNVYGEGWPELVLFYALASTSLLAAVWWLKDERRS